MFERFTNRARQVVVLAQEEARLLSHNYIGTEHILLGIVHEGNGVAAQALESLNISLERVRQEVVAIVGRGKKEPSGHIPFTPRAKKVLELSLREALQLGHNYIGSEHILLGLLREGEGVAAQVLARLGGDLKAVRQRVISLTPGEEDDDDLPPVSGPVHAVTRFSEIADSLAAIAERLAAIEAHLGIARQHGASAEVGSSQASPDASEGDGGGGSGGGPDESEPGAGRPPAAG
jgi:ATP-dependent Clp protease ATP-binding subunit ClpC